MSASLDRGWARASRRAAAKSRSGQITRGNEVSRKRLLLLFENTNIKNQGARGGCCGCKRATIHIFFPKDFLCSNLCPFPGTYFIIPSPGGASPAAWPLLPPYDSLLNINLPIPFLIMKMFKEGDPLFLSLNYMPKGPSPSSLEKLSNYYSLVPLPSPHHPWHPSLLTPTPACC